MEKSGKVRVIFTI